MHEKTFYKVITELYLLSKSDKDVFSDKRLTRTEKKILEGYLLIRTNQNQEAYYLMRDLPATGLPYVDAQRLLLIGLALNNLSHFKDAETSLLLAAEEFQKLEADVCLFVAYTNLFFLYFNLQNENSMNSIMLKLNQLPIETDVQKARLLRCQFTYEMQMDNFAMGSEFLLMLAPLKHLLPSSDVIAHLICEFMFYIKQEKFSDCYRLLDEMKSHRSFHLSENFNFMKKLLDHLVLESPIYLTNLKEYEITFLWHQLKVIDALEQGELDLAREHWDKLSKIMPNTFLPNFNFKGKKCIFSLCLDKHQKILEQSNPRELSLPTDSSHINKLMHVLSNSPGTITKGHLFELIWGFPPRDKGDMQKLARLVYEAKNRKGLKISSRKNSYVIENIKQRKVG